MNEGAVVPCTVGLLQVCSYKNFCRRWGNWIPEVQVSEVSLYVCSTLYNT